MVPNERTAQNRFRIVSHGTDDWNPSSDQQLLRAQPPLQSSYGDIESVVKDAGYSLDLSDKADERPPERDYELAGLGTQFEVDDESEELEMCIRRLRVVERKNIFLPIDGLERCMTADNIRRELERAGGCPHMEETTKALCQRGKTSMQRIFAILCMLDMSTYIFAFIQEGLLDTDLPFVFESDVVFGTASEGSTKPPKIIALFRNAVWTARLREFFDEYQRQLTAPIFKFSWLAHEKVLHFPLNGQLVLPFVYIADTKFEGGTSVVRKVKIHPAHYNAPKEVVSPQTCCHRRSTNAQKIAKSEMCFAIKELKLRRGRHEAIALKRLNNKQHPHLIRLLATYTYENLFHLIFPWADGNLGEFWETRSQQYPRQDRDPSLVIWMAKQILGLARALQLIHYCETDKTNLQGLSPEELKRLHGRHGDLKPENILWFKDDHLGEKDSMGVLKIADFGFADFHSKFSKSRVRRSAVPGVTYTYSAPEYDVSQQVSPQFDIWSFGCVLLQFVVWYLYGWEGIDEFSKKRTAQSKGFVVRIDSFYSLHAKGTQARLKDSVTEVGILHVLDLNACLHPSQQMFRQLKKHEGCSDYILELVECVETHLLRVDSAKRAGIDEIVRKFEDLEKECAKTIEYCIMRQKEAALHGPSLPEIVELPEYQDRISPSTSYPQTPASIWEGNNEKGVGDKKARIEKDTMAYTPNGLGISAPGPVALHKSKINPRNPAILERDSSPPNDHQLLSREDPSMNIGSDASYMPRFVTHEFLQDEVASQPPAQKNKDMLASALGTDVQSPVESEHGIANHSSSSTSNIGNTVPFQVASSSMPMVPQDDGERRRPPAPLERRRTRSKRRIIKLLDLCFGSG